MYYFLCIILYVLFFPPAHADAETFFVDKKFDEKNREEVTADALHAGAKSIFFIERDYYNFLPADEGLETRKAIEYLMSEFENKIYPKLREVFGSERSPGADGDEKVKIVLHRMKKGIGGYVREEDMNEGEIIYLNSLAIHNRTLAPAYLAHEFQHLITFNQKNIMRGLKEEQWLNEARSEYAPTILGYNDEYKGSYLEKRVNEFLAHPSDALLHWRGLSSDHAASSMFTHYLTDRFGAQVLTGMMEADSVGIDSIQYALLGLGSSERFADIFSDWILTLYINSSLNDENKFKYKTPYLSFANLHVLPTTIFRTYDNNSSGASFVIDNWSGQWHRFIPGAVGEDTSLHIRFTAVESEGLRLPYIVNDFFGGAEVKYWDLHKGNILSVDGFGRDIASVVIAPILAKENEGSESSSLGFSLESFISDTFASRFAEGALVRAKNDPMVYVVKNSPKIGEVFVRWIQKEEVFGFYKHFSWNDVIEIKPELLFNFKESFLVRQSGDYKIYEVDRLGRKKWLDMSSLEFEQKGYKWEAVYEVNEAEFHWFRKSQ